MTSRSPAVPYSSCTNTHTCTTTDYVLGSRWSHITPPWSLKPPPHSVLIPSCVPSPGCSYQIEDFLTEGEYDYMEELIDQQYGRFRASYTDQDVDTKVVDSYRTSSFIALRYTHKSRYAVVACLHF